MEEVGVLEWRKGGGSNRKEIVGDARDRKSGQIGFGREFGSRSLIRHTRISHLSRYIYLIAISSNRVGRKALTTLAASSAPKFVSKAGFGASGEISRPLTFESTIPS